MVEVMTRTMRAESQSANRLLSFVELAGAYLHYCGRNDTIKGACYLNGGASKEDVAARHPLCVSLTEEVHCVRVRMSYSFVLVNQCRTLSVVRWRAI